MYLSGIENSDLTLAIELNENFLHYLNDILLKLNETKLNYDTITINFSNSKARLLENGFVFYEDRQIREINNGESFLEYHGFQISKHCFPTEGYWKERQPDKVLLTIHGKRIGFTFKHDIDLEFRGTLLDISEWQKWLR